MQKTDHQRKSFAASVRKYMIDNGWDIVVEVINAIVSILMVLTFCVFTYVDQYNPYNPKKLVVP